LLERTHIVYIHQVESRRSVRAFNRTGKRVLAHASAAGKALLAHEPEAVIASLRSTGVLDALTDATITTADELIAQLAEVRRRGFALDLAEQDPDIICVAAPV
jgi:DNA-binding IclR family transcriptional regulator